MSLKTASESFTTSRVFTTRGTSRDGTRRVAKQTNVRNLFLFVDGHPNLGIGANGRGLPGRGDFTPFGAKVEKASPECDSQRELD